MSKNLNQPRIGLLAVAAICMVLAASAYLIGEVVTARAWTNPPYNWANNLVPDLGNTACGPYQNRIVCSPSHDLMNSAFIAQAVLFGIASILMALFFTAKTRSTMIALGLTHAVGLVLVGVFPHSPAAAANGTLMLNFLGAGLSIIAGNLIIVIAGRQWQRLRLPSWIGPMSVALGGIGIVVGTALLMAQWGPPGLRERISIYSFILWQIVAGSILLHVTQPLKLVLTGSRDKIRTTTS